MAVRKLQVTLHSLAYTRTERFTRFTSTAVYRIKEYFREVNVQIWQLANRGVAQGPRKGPLFTVSGKKKHSTHTQKKTTKTMPASWMTKLFISVLLIWDTSARNEEWVLYQAVIFLWLKKGEEKRGKKCFELAASLCIDYGCYTWVAVKFFKLA